ncbi:MAG: alpha-amylase family glycosyl hydrolase [Kiritimatiellae bacterium]|nr:alpha-amylase family glycosyl hydrolase [Kiritimatiellia bacterium]MDD5519184.1 alpha-amylase family glycosyl hydrolase [Kiritimatiellia bacterium]
MIPETTRNKSLSCRIFLWTFAFLLNSIIGFGAESVENLASLQARSAPEWLTRGVIYQVWLRAFTPEGTLKAATARLPQVAELGATIIYLCPIMLSDDDMRQEFWSTRQKASGTNNPRNPYRMKDYNKVDPEYGNDADLREFVETAHKLGMYVLVDLVYFHCGPTSVLMEHPEYFKQDASGKVSTGSWNFPVLNFNNQQLREHLWANMHHWIKDFNMDGFRCDVADMVPLDFWEEARKRLETIRPDLVILAEGQRAADQVKAFDIDYGFSWYGAIFSIFNKGKPVSSLQDIWKKQSSERPRGARFMRYTENHDLVNDMQHSEVICGERGSTAISVVNFTLDGVPMLYNGQEIGDTTQQSIYALRPVRWEAACLPKMKSTLDFYKKLCQMRRSEQVLANGEVVWLENDQPDSVVSFIRRTGNESIISVVNLSNRKVKVRVTLPEGYTTSYKPLLSDRTKISTENGKLSFDLENFGYFVGKNNNK